MNEKSLDLPMIFKKIPISKFAFMPGKLVHTNEILVLLGDNWFVEKSAKQACELIDRRLNNIDHHLDELNQEKTKFGDRLKWTKSLIEVNPS
jgi:unconventional prefoldin RPB5 interactor 1